MYVSTFFLLFSIQTHTHIFTCTWGLGKPVSQREREYPGILLVELSLIWQQPTLQGERGLSRLNGCRDIWVAVLAKNEYRVFSKLMHGVQCCRTSSED